MRANFLYNIVGLLFITLCTGCYTSKRNIQLSLLTTDSLLNKAFVGFKIMDLDNNEILEELNPNKYFIPASNTKLLTMYSALNTFGDSIPGWFIAEDAHTLYIEPNGDPTFLNPEFKDQKLLNLLTSTKKNVNLIIPHDVSLRRFGAGWSWTSYRETYALERNTMPIYGNLVTFTKTNNGFVANPSLFTDSIELSSDEVMKSEFASVQRHESSNTYIISQSSNRNNLTSGFTFENNPDLSYLLLKDTLSRLNPLVKLNRLDKRPDALNFIPLNTVNTDELLGIMMKRSDNFLAEQILIMVGKYITGISSDMGAIKALRENMFKGLLDNNSRWADGSGLSRNNLISPQEFVNLLTEIYKKGDSERVSKILPSGNQGTLSGLYIGYEKHIFAKTGTLSDHLGLSGYLKTKANRNLVFSFLINNHRGSANDYRRKIEKILLEYIENK